MIVILALAILISGCDSRRNKILKGILVSPTVTETPFIPTETPTPSPTETPFPTPTPYFTVENMELLQFGDYDLADYQIKSRINNARNGSDKLKAIADRMELYWHRSEYGKCMQAMEEAEELIRTSADVPEAVAAKTYYLYAQCAAGEGLREQEIEYLGKYLECRQDTPILEDVYEEIAETYHDLGDYDNYRLYADRILALNEETKSDYLLLDYAVSYYLGGDNDEAIKQLTGLFDTSADENIKAAAEYYLGAIYEDEGQTDQAVSRYMDTVNTYPRSYYSYLSLVWLLDNEYPVSDYQRGLINYYVGQYSLANDAFRRYMKSEPGNDGASWYFIGLCLMNLGDYDGAADAYKKLIDEYPSNRYYVPCWDELAYVQWAGQSKHQKAAETLTSYVKQHPDQPDSAAFLMEAGRILERGNYLSEAARTWSRLIDEYPLYEDSKQALFLAAVSSYRIADYETAIAYLNRLLLVSGIPDDQAKGYFWIAKCYLKKNDTYNMQKYLELAAKQSKTGYYSLRAAEMAEGKNYLSASSAYDFSIDLEFEKQVADQWMMLTFNLTPESLNGVPVYLSDPNYRMANEYYALGQYYLASVWFDNVREEFSENPGALYNLLDELASKRMYSAAAYTSRDILTAAGLYEDDRTMDVPNYFNHIRFGPWFSRYTLEACANYDVSPYVMYAIMKQESMFNPWIASAAGARGLMQIMPETGAEIAKTLHWPPNYTDADLTRVPVSVSFAGSYLKRLYGYFDQSPAAMLSAYNGGAGNTQKWLIAADSDPDLLYEVIRFQETRNYLHNVYRNAKIYEWIYTK